MSIAILKKCQIDNCNNRLFAVGVCSAHYWRFKKYGSYDTPPLARPIEQRFFSKVIKGADGECWQWIGSKCDKGYGKFIFNGGQLAHRFSFLMHNGTLPPYRADNGDLIVIMHSCDNTSCVNPDHLSIGTHRQNVRDAFARGLIIPSGKGGKRSISSSTAIAIFSENGKYKDIADKYGCLHGVVTGIKCGRRWKKIIAESFS